MTRLVFSLLALVLCMSALTGSRAGGVRKVVTTNRHNYNAPTHTNNAPTHTTNAPTHTMNSAVAPAAATNQAAANQPAATTQAADVPQTTTPTTVFPPAALQIFAVDIHFVPGYDLSSAYIAYHYCGSGPGVTQCAIYDGVGQDAKLIAIELIVPGSVFETFSDAEKSLWHSHDFAIASGTFVLPEFSAEKELSILEGLATTYGKVTNLYQPETAAPTGNVQTAFGITNQAQLDQVLGLARQIDQGLSLTTTYLQRAAARRNFQAAPVIQGQDPYHQTGFLPQYTVESVQVNKVTGEPI